MLCKDIPGLGFLPSTLCILAAMRWAIWILYTLLQWFSASLQSRIKKNLIEYVLKALKPSVKANSHSCKLFSLRDLSLWQRCDWCTFWPVEWEIGGAIWLASKRNKLHMKKCTISKVHPFEATVSAGAINNTVHRWTCKCRGI